MTPYEINLLLHYYSSGVDHEDIHRNPPVWLPTIAAFKRDGLIEDARGRRHHCTYQLTEKGNFYVEHGLCALPLPVSKWGIPRNDRPSLPDNAVSK